MVFRHTVDARLCADVQLTVEAGWYALPVLPCLMHLSIVWKR